MVTTDDGRPRAVLRFGQGKHTALLEVAPGHLAIVQRADAIPADIRPCAAKLSRFQSEPPSGTGASPATATTASVFA